MRHVLRCFLLFAGVAGLLTLSACQSLPVHSRPSEAVVKERVAALMEAKVHQDWGKFYTFLDPEYQKQVSQKNFVNRKRGVRFIDYSIQSIQVDPSGRKAEVVVVCDMMARSFRFADQRQTQKWLKKGGEWYLEMQQHGNPMGGGKPSSPHAPD